MSEGAAPKPDAKVAFADASEQAEKADVKIVAEESASSQMRIVGERDASESIKLEMSAAGNPLLLSDAHGSTGSAVEDVNTNNHQGKSDLTNRIERVDGGDEAPSSNEAESTVTQHWDGSASLPSEVSSSPFEKLLKEFRQLVASGTRFLLISTGCVLAVVFVACIWGKQILGTIDTELAKNPYTAVPVAKLAEPLFTDKRVPYAKVLVQAAVERRKIDSAPGYLPASQSLSIPQQMERMNLHTNPLIAYAAVESAGRAAASHPAEEKRKKTVEDDLQRAIDYASTLVGPDNRLTAQANRQAAAYYLNLLTPSSDNLKTTEKLIQAARRIDGTSGVYNQHEVLDDQRILAALYTRQHRPDSAQVWGEASRRVGAMEGENSISKARVKLDQAIYSARFGNVAASLEPATAGANILMSKTRLDTQPSRFRSLIAGDLSSESMMEYYMSLVRSEQSLGTTERAKFNELETRFLSWYQQYDPPRKYFDLLVNIADQYNASKHYGQADGFYKRALKLAVTKPSRFRTRGLNNNIRATEWFSLAMAKLANNAIQQGNFDEGVMVAANCVKILHPYGHWWTTEDYGPTLDQLVRTLGPIEKQNLTVPLRNVVSSLEDILEMRRLRRGTSCKMSLQYLAELHELGGNLKQAEQDYKRAADTEPSAVTLGGLAAFYCKVGKYELAEPLFQRSEAYSKRSDEEKNPNEVVRGSFVNTARMKRLLDCTPDQSVFERFSWLEPVRRDIAQCRTSYDLGRRVTVLDLRPWISDFRKSGSSPGVVYAAHQLRGALSSLSDENKKLARKFSWFNSCFPKSLEKEIDYVTATKESLPSTQVVGSTRRPRSPFDLMPSHVIIMSDEDSMKLTRLIGKDISHKNRIVP